MAKFRIVCTPLAGAPAFLQSRKTNTAEIYRPFDGAVLETPSTFQPYQTNSRTVADTMARLAENNVMRAHVIEWEK